MTINKNFKKYALTLSIIMLIIWGILGTGTSIAWFSDETPEIKNVFHTADFNIEVSYRYDGKNYKSIEGETDLFDKNALYEPGYVEVIFLKVKNKGSVPFDFQTAVSVYKYVPAINHFGQSFTLQDYLKFGIISAPTEQALDEKLKNREAAIQNANMPLNSYSTDEVPLAKNSEAYVAVIVRMPEEVGNATNHRGSEPQVELGIIVNATQRK